MKHLIKLILVASLLVPFSVQAKLPTPEDEVQLSKEIECLAKNIYFEARGEKELGKRAVAHVTINRMKSKRFPNSICKVVYQANRDANGNVKKHQCQFSWYCDGYSDKVRNKALWDEIVSLSTSIVKEYEKQEDPTQGAVMYHATHMTPYWAKSFTKTVKIDKHQFYK